MMETVVFYTAIDILALAMMYWAERLMCNSQSGTYRISLHKFRISNIYIWASFFVLWMILSLRSGIGKDYAIYARTFLDINGGGLSDTEQAWLAPGYRLLCEFIGFFDETTYEIMFAALGFFTLYYVYKAICIGSCNKTYSLYIFICFCLYYQCFNQSRQMLAIAICTYAITYLQQNKVLPYILYVILAISFHVSAVVMLPLLLVRNWDINCRHLVFYIAIGAGGVLGFEIIRSLMANTFYGAIYLGSTIYDLQFSPTVIINTCMRSGMLLFCLLFYKSTVRRNNHTKLLFNMAIVCTIVQCLTVQSYLFGRITTYFFVSYLFLIPEVTVSLANKFRPLDRKWVYSIMVILLGVYHYAYYFMGGAESAGYDVYQTFLF